MMSLPKEDAPTQQVENVISEEKGVASPTEHHVEGGGDMASLSDTEGADEVKNKDPDTQTGEGASLKKEETEEEENLEIEDQNKDNVKPEMKLSEDDGTLAIHHVPDTKTEGASAASGSKEVNMEGITNPITSADKITMQFREVKRVMQKALKNTGTFLAGSDDIAKIRSELTVVSETCDNLEAVVRDMKGVVPAKEIESFESQLFHLEEEQKELAARASEQIRSIRVYASSSSSASIKRTKGKTISSGARSQHSTSSRKSNKEQLQDVQKDLAAINAKLAFAKQEEEIERREIELRKEEFERKSAMRKEELERKYAMQKQEFELKSSMQKKEFELKSSMQKKELELKQKRRTLDLQKAAAEKQAVAQECRKVEKIENPFGIDDDLAENDITGKKPGVRDLPIVPADVKTAEYVNTLEPAAAETPFVVPAPSTENPIENDPVPNSNNVDSSSRPCNLTRNRQTVCRIPDIKVWTFHGNPTEYPEWEASYKALVEGRVSNIYEKMNLLKQHLGPEPMKVMKGYFMTNTEESYAKAARELRRRYGSAVVVGHAFLSQLKAWRRIKDDDTLALRDFSDFLEHVAEIKKRVSELDTLGYSSNHMYIVKKLPADLADKWRGKVLKYKNKLDDDDAYPPFENFVKFVRERSDRKNMPEFQILDNDKFYNHKNAQSKGSNWQSNKSSATGVVLGTNAKPQNDPCVHCESNDHHVSECTELAKLPKDERGKVMREHYLCYGCGNKCSKTHKGRTCSRRVKCKKCGKLHLTSLHEEVASDGAVAMCASVCGKTEPAGRDHSMLVPVWVRKKSDPSHEIVCYAALDMMSNCSFITRELQNDLGVKGQGAHVNLSTMHGHDTLEMDKILDLEVLSYDHKQVVHVPMAYSREEIPTYRSQIPKADVCNQWKHLKDVSEKLPPYLPEANVCVLLGSDVPKAITPREVVAGESNEPFGMRTDLGWGVVGRVCKDVIDEGKAVSHRVVAYEKPEVGNFVLATKAKELINPNAVRNMFELEFSEHKGKEVAMSIEDKRFLKIISEGIRQRPDGHLEMPLPLRHQSAPIPNNKSYVQKRTCQLGKRLIKNVKLRDDYCGFMSDIIRLHAEEVPEDEINWDDGQINYLIHMGVYHPRKPDQIRVVFDGSASYMGVCLNDFLLTGPDFLNGMLGVFCRMRKFKHALSTDVQKMFFQFYVPPKHRNLIRFLFWENNDIENGKLKEYRLKVHLFGASSSPACCNFGLKRAADDGEAEFGTAAADFIRDNFYVDDGLISLDDEDALISLAKSSKDLCASFGLKLCKFVSNSRKVMESIPLEDRAKDVKELDLKNDPLPSVRTLGIVWCVENDSLQFRIELKDTPCTRRGILSSIASIYDLLGLAAPVLLEGKLILQSLCRLNASWDDPVPDDLRMRWEKWRTEIPLIESLEIRRCYKPADFGKVKAVEFHHFSDASQLAYGQCSYVRLIDENDDVSCALMIGKARVAPLKKEVSIPRLELSAAVVSARMSKFLSDELQYDDVTEYFWVDSMVVLGYVKNEAKRFHVYVANRIQVIHDYTKPECWYHVPSASNPSDDASRGMSAKELTDDCRWLAGPEFLWTKGEVVPPQSEFKPTEQTKAEIRHEMRKATAFQCNVVSDPNPFGILEVDRLRHFSRWDSSCRSVAFCLRFIKKLQKVDPTELNTGDMMNAERLMIRSAQYECFAREIDDLNKSKLSPDKGQSIQRDSSLYRLNPFLDDFGLLRVGGRMEYSDETFEIKHPVIIPKKSCITDMLVRHFHERENHPGRYMTLNAIRQHGYWLINGSSVVSRAITKCVICRKMRRPVENQQMANLPSDRFDVEAPFTFSGCDVFGVYQIKEKRSILKRYCVIFTCMSSRAVHLESLNFMTTDSFLNALRRFLARRGPIQQLRCDCGTNFVGASNELKKAVQEMNQDKVKDFLLKENCDYFEFKFTVPHGSHMSGFVERQIRTVKAALDPLLMQFGHILCDESYRTFLVEVENIVNSRPLSVENLNDSTAPVPLTPQQILTLKSKVLMPPPGVFQKADQYLLRRWRRVQYLANEFWHKWKKQYVASLQPRQKWNAVKRDLQKGDVVLICDPNLPRNTWKLGRVDLVFPSEDGLVRKVKVLVGTRELDKKGKRSTSATFIERPILKLVLLVPDDS